MENGANALIIAGGILLAILIVSVGVKLYGVFDTKTQEYKEIWTTTEIQKFNTNFEKFIGQDNISAQEIVSLYNLVAEYKNEKGINVKILGVNNLEKNTIIKFLQNNYKYKFKKISYDSNTGIVNGITFTKK